MIPQGVFTGDDVANAKSINADVLIIGSGAGGATMAAELAEAGFDVAVVEEGNYYTTDYFSADTSKMLRTLYRDAGATVAVGNPPVLYQEGRVVGGSSVINGAMSWRTPDRILADWQSDLGLDEFALAKLEPYFERVERRISVGYQDPHTIGRDNALLKEGAEALGWETIPNLRNQVHCAGSNNCAFGCPTGAKQSTLVTYIRRALHFGAKIYTQTRVDKLTFKRKKVTGATATVTTSEGKKKKVKFHAKIVVSSCGSIHTPSLLMRSGLKHPELGKNLSLHPNCKVTAIFDEPVRGWEGVHQGFQVREFSEEGIFFAAVNIPPSILALSLPFKGKKLGSIMERYDRMLIAGLLTEDSTRGSVKNMPGGTPQAFYDLNDQDFSLIQTGLSRLGKLLFKVGAKEIILPFEGAPICTDQRSLDDAVARAKKKHAEVVTVHLMGTAKTSRHPNRGVVDSFGRVHDTSGLFVADASIFPGPIGVNPAETIQALSTHHAAYIIDNRGTYLR